MIKFNTFIPKLAPLSRVSISVKDLKNLKYAPIGKSGLPVEMPLNLNNDKKVIAMLQDSFNYERAKDAITVAINYSKK